MRTWWAGAADFARGWATRFLERESRGACHHMPKDNQGPISFENAEPESGTAPPVSFVRKTHTHCAFTCIWLAMSACDVPISVHSRA